jgi:hypothetical protein
MNEVISIRRDQQAMQRSPEEAIRELHDCIIAVNASMEVLAQLYPGATLLAGVVRGEPCTTVAFTTSQEGDHFTLGAMNAARGLARVVASFLPELQDVFAIELKYAAETRQIRRDMEVAVQAALRAAAETGRR